MFKKFIYSILFVFCLFGMSFAQEAEPSKSTPVKITRSAKPGYTDEARKYNISGTVLLRVEFLASGKIGKVEEIAEENDDDLRKYGLARKAIEAAKSIKFKPATENGKPVTKIKSIMLTFNIIVRK